MRITKKLDLIVTTIELAAVGVRLAGAVKQGLEMRREKLKGRA